MLLSAQGCVPENFSLMSHACRPASLRINISMLMTIQWISFEVTGKRRLPDSCVSGLTSITRCAGVIGTSSSVPAARCRRGLPGLSPLCDVTVAGLVGARSAVRDGTSQFGTGRLVRRVCDRVSPQGSVQWFEFIFVSSAGRLARFGQREGAQSRRAKGE